MNFDSYYDPPEFDDPPQCKEEGCEGFTEYVSHDDKFTYVKCDTCGATSKIPQEIYIEPELTVEQVEQIEDKILDENRPCPHGIIGDCNACNVASDFLYDANRERR